MRINLPTNDLENRVAAVLQSETLFRTRRNKQYDLRPLIQDLCVMDSTHLSARLTMLPKATGRPEEVLQAMQIDPK